MKVNLGNIEFNGLPKELLYNIFKDGRASSKLMEHYLANMFGMTHIKGDLSYDLLDKTGCKVEVKAFSKYGCDFRPSMQKGDKGLAKRIRINEGQEAYETHLAILKISFNEVCDNMDYIIYDISTFPMVDIRKINGKELRTLYPKGKIAYKNKEDFFG